MEIIYRLIREGTLNCIGLNVPSPVASIYLLFEPVAISQYNDRATELTTKDRTYVSGRGNRFPLPESPDRLCGLASLLFSGYREISMWIMFWWNGDGRSLQSSAVNKNAWKYSSTLSTVMVFLLS
jgi:hypothetical protein